MHNDLVIFHGYIVDDFGIISISTTNLNSNPVWLGLVLVKRVSL